MRCVARVMLPCLLALLLGALLLAPPPARAETQPASDKTYDAPPHLREVGRLLRDLFKQERWADLHAICEQGYAQATDDETRAFYMHQDAIAYLRQRDPRGLDMLYQVLHRFPAAMQAPLATLDLGDTYLYLAEAAQEGDTRRALALQALEALDRFVAAYPTHERIVRALWKRGWCYKLLEEWEAMLADYQYASDVYPNSPWTHVCLEWVVALKQSAGAHDAAILDGRRYLELYPDQHPDYVQYLIGRSVLAQGDEEQALVEFDKAIGLTRPDEEKRAKIINLVCTHLVSLGRYDKAHAYLKPLIADPNPAFDGWRENSQYLDGLAYFLARDYANALAVFGYLQATSDNAVLKAQLDALIEMAESPATP